MNSTDPQPDLSEYRLAVLAALRRDGYAVETALNLCRRYADTIRGGYVLGMGAMALAGQIVLGEEEADDTPLLPQSLSGACR